MWVRDHLPWAVALGWSGIVAVRIVSVTGGDASAAYTVVGSTAIFSVAMAVAVAVIPAVAYTLTLLFASTLWTHGARASAVGVAALAFAVGLLATPILLFVLTPVLAIVISRLGDGARHRATGTFAEKREARRRSLASAGVFLIVIVLVLVIAPSPWVPAEKIRVEGTTTPMVGYVLSSDEWVTLLTTDRRIRYVKGSAVVSREVCDVGRRVGPDWLGTLASRTAFSLLHFASPELPSCPDSP